MPSEVDLCNLSLAQLGDAANISSISPPDSSAQAVHCSRFYPMARDALLEMHDWNFATRRASLSLLGDSTTETGDWCSQWIYSYAAPADMMVARKVIAADAPDDWSANVPSPFTPPFCEPAIGQGLYTPQRYIVEAKADGAIVIRTNQKDAHLLYTVKVTDPTKFSALFSASLVPFLAHYLAGPIIKGTEGISVSNGMLQRATAILARATASDSSQRRVDIVPAVPWMVR
jgi:hypothetical protein